VYNLLVLRVAYFTLFVLSPIREPWKDFESSCFRCKMVAWSGLRLIGAAAVAGVGSVVGLMQVDSKYRPTNYVKILQCDATPVTANDVLQVCEGVLSILFIVVIGYANIDIWSASTKCCRDD
jgi:hypothetical protein